MSKESKGTLVGTVAIVVLIVYVLFGISDPIEVYDGFVSLIQNISEKGEWVKNLWTSIIQGDLKEGWKYFMSNIKSMFEINIFGWFK